MSVSALGVAYHVLNEVDSVIEGSPAAKAGMKPGDVLVEATLIPPDKETLEKLDSRAVEGCRWSLREGPSIGRR